MVDVAGQGEFQALLESWDTCYPEPSPFTWGDSRHAQAGVGCAHCAHPCCQYISVPVMDPPLLEMEGVAGELVEGEILVTLEGWVEHDELVYEITAPYLTLEEEWLSWNEVLLTVTADAGGLAPGYHGSWNRTYIPETDCRGCTEILLDVQPATPARQASWGEMKGLFGR